MNIKLKLKVRALLALYGALAQLDGYPQVVGEKIALVPYKLGDAARKAISRNLRALRPIVDEHTDVKNGIILEVSNGTGHIDEASEPAKVAAVSVREAVLLLEERDVELCAISEEALLSDDKNPIPGAVLEALGPVLTST